MMIRILYLCREYGWSLEYVLGLPFKAIEPIQTNTQRLQNNDRVELLRIALANGTNSKYHGKLMEHYTKSSMNPKNIPKPKSVNTTQAFDMLRGRI